MEKQNEKTPRSAVVSKLKVECTLNKLERQIKRFKIRVDELEAKKHILSVHGIQDLGYFKGRLSAMEDIADDIKELLESSEERWDDQDGGM